MPSYADTCNARCAELGTYDSESSAMPRLRSKRRSSRALLVALDVPQLA